MMLRQSNGLCLIVLWEQEGITTKELADNIVKDKPNTNHILEKL